MLLLLQFNCIDRSKWQRREAAAWALFEEILRAEEKAGRNMGNNLPPRARMLALYAECLTVTMGRPSDWLERAERLLH